MKYYHRLQVPEATLRKSHYDACSLVTLGDIVSDICHFPPWPFLIHVTGIIHTILFRTKIIPFKGLCFASSPLKIPHWWRQLHWNNYACANKALEFYHLEISFAEPWVNLAAARSFCLLTQVYITIYHRAGVTIKLNLCLIMEKLLTFEFVAAFRITGSRSLWALR